MQTEELITKADGLVSDWAKKWQREGRLEGGLDRVAKKDLVERVALALSHMLEETKPVKKAGKKADPNG